MSDQTRPGLSPVVAIDEARVQSDAEAWLARSRAAWDARVERWDARAEANAAAPDREADLRRVWDAMGLGSGSRLLDAGCGCGQFAIAFAQRGARVTGVDLSPAMIARARAHAAAREIAVEWRIGDVT